MTNWDRRFMALAYHISSWSKDQSTKVGCVIVGTDHEVLTTGYNRFPKGVRDLDDRHTRPMKYLWTEHAERNAIYAAAKTGIALRDCRMYLSWFPCMDCARAIVESGLSELVALRPDLEHPIWGKHSLLATELFEEAGIRVRWYEDHTETSSNDDEHPTDAA